MRPRARRASRPRRGKPRRLVLRLYVAGPSRNSAAARANLHAVCAGLPAGEIQLEVVDVFRHPEHALRDGVRVTPTLIRVSPGPVRMIVGDLSDQIVVRATLGLKGGR